jgi:hypothetical protein
MGKKFFKAKKQPLPTYNGWQIYLIVIVGLILFLFLGLPDEILYAKAGLFRWLPFILIFLVLPYFIFKLFSVITIGGDWIVVLAIGSVLIVGSIFGFWTGYLSDKDLERYGKNIDGIVSEKWKSKHKWLFKCKFKVEHKVYETFSFTDKENKYQIGDTLFIRYSSKAPDNNKIVVVNKK